MLSLKALATLVFSLGLLDSCRAEENDLGAARETWVEAVLVSDLRMRVDQMLLDYRSMKEHFARFVKARALFDETRSTVREIALEALAEGRKAEEMECLGELTEALFHFSDVDLRAAQGCFDRPRPTVGRIRKAHKSWPSRPTQLKRKGFDALVPTSRSPTEKDSVIPVVVGSPRKRRFGLRGPSPSRPETPPQTPPPGPPTPPPRSGFGRRFFFPESALVDTEGRIGGRVADDALGGQLVGAGDTPGGQPVGATASPPWQSIMAAAGGSAIETPSIHLGDAGFAPGAQPVGAAASPPVQSTAAATADGSDDSPGGQLAGDAANPPMQATAALSLGSTGHEVGGQPFIDAGDGLGAHAVGAAVSPPSQATATAASVADGHTPGGLQVGGTGEASSGQAAGAVVSAPVQAAAVAASSAAASDAAPKSWTVSELGVSYRGGGVVFDKG